MKRSVCLLLISIALLAFSACTQLSPSSESEKMTAASEALSGESVSTEKAALPSGTLTEEEQLAMWKAVIEEMSKNDLTQEQALGKVSTPSSLELLKACGAELLALELPDRDSRWTVQPLYETWMVLYQTTSKSLLDFDSKSCKRLLDWEIVKDIQIDGDKVRFSIGGRGFGPQTEYYSVYYLPSDNIKGCFAYNSNLKFEELDGGWFARADGSDNTVFYRQLEEHLYFVAEHY